MGQGVDPGTCPLGHADMAEHVLSLAGLMETCVAINYGLSLLLTPHVSDLSH